MHLHVSVKLAFFYGCFLTILNDSLHLLHFPTRRSSDLVGHDSFRQDDLAAEPLGLLEGARHIGSFHVEGRPRPGPRKQDRKSTRLNSSHLVISYAVFCLKKKR